MTLEEAKKEKLKYADYFIRDSREYETFIIPENDEDFNEFKKHGYVYGFDITKPEQFARNKNYMLCAISYKGQGIITDKNIPLLD